MIVVCVAVCAEQAVIQNPSSYEVLDPRDFGVERNIQIAHRLTGLSDDCAVHFALCISVAAAFIVSVVLYLRCNCRSVLGWNAVQQRAIQLGLTTLSEAKVCLFIISCAVILTSSAQLCFVSVSDSHICRALFVSSSAAVILTSVDHICALADQGGDIVHQELGGHG